MNLTVPWKSSTDNPGNGIEAKLDAIRQSISEQAETVADVASDFGSDASSQASTLADEAAIKAKKVAQDTGTVVADVANDSMKSLSGFFQSLIAAIGALVASLTASGKKTAADLGHEAQSAASELRKVRITTEPKKSGPNFMPGVALLAGFSAGVAVAYFFDPEQGKGRRALLRDQVTKWTRVTTEEIQGRTKDLSNRAQGAAIEARRSLQGVMPSGQPAADTDTQPWGTVSDAFGAGSPGASDPSTTDTWGEQPQSNESERIGIG